MLLRRQAIEKQSQRLYGKVIIATPLSFWGLAVFLVTIIAVAFSFAAFSTFSKIEPVHGAIVPSGGIAIVRSSSGGLVADFNIKEGTVVARGDLVGRVVNDGSSTTEGTRLAAELQQIVLGRAGRPW